MSDTRLLRNIYLFKELTDKQLEEVSQIVEIISLAAGEVVFSQGEAATALYLIKFGSVKIQQRANEGEMVNITNMATGSHFGEMAFLDAEKRSATASTTERTELLKIDYNRLRQLLAEHQDIAIVLYHSLAKFLCGRLRITTEDLNFARELNLRHF